MSRRVEICSRCYVRDKARAEGLGGDGRGGTDILGGRWLGRNESASQRGSWSSLFLHSRNDSNLRVFGESVSGLNGEGCLAAVSVRRDEHET